RPPGHIPRPPNAFIIFRTEYIRSMATQNSTPEVSKNLGEMWRKMSPVEKRPYNEKAEEAKIMHMAQNPGYKYKP
ncbi:high mobility group box domain-containing protein, partial [Gautieria morchelliformis]